MYELPSKKKVRGLVNSAYVQKSLNSSSIFKVFLEEALQKSADEFYRLLKETGWAVQVPLIYRNSLFPQKSSAFTQEFSRFLCFLKQSFALCTFLEVRRDHKFLEIPRNPRHSWKFSEAKNS